MNRFLVEHSRYERPVLKAGRRTGYDVQKPNQVSGLKCIPINRVWCFGGLISDSFVYERTLNLSCNYNLGDMMKGEVVPDE
jgi:hypothetical protein